MHMLNTHTHESMHKQRSQGKEIRSRVCAHSNCVLAVCLRSSKDYIIYSILNNCMHITRVCLRVSTAHRASSFSYTIIHKL